MDCVCSAESTAVDAVLDPVLPCYYVLQRATSGYSLQTREQAMVTSDYMAQGCMGPIQLVVCGEWVLCSSAPNVMAVYGKEGFRATFHCAGPIPYVVDRVAASKEYLYFSTSHSFIYACSLSTLAQLSADRSPLKLKLPKGVLVLSMQQKPTSPPYLAAACSDGLVLFTQIRIWNVLSQEEEIGILDPAKDVGLNKKVILKLIKTEAYPPINCIDFTSEGARLLAGSQTGVVNIWRTERLPST